MTRNASLLIGCGILRKEERLLIDKNQWPLRTLFLDSALHVDYDKLSSKCGKYWTERRDAGARNG